MNEDDIERELSGDRSNNQSHPLQTGLNLFLYKGTDVLSSMIEEYFTPKSKDPAYQYGICLHSEPSGDDSETIRSWVRIPTEHSMIIQPRSPNDLEVFSMHAECITVGETQPNPGQVVKVALKNPGINTGYQVGEILEVLGGNVSYVAGGIGGGSETFETCFFGSEPPSSVLPPAGETTTGANSEEDDTPTYKERTEPKTGVGCGKIYKFADFAAQDLASMNTSGAGIGLIHESEAFRELPYEDANSRRLWTVGWGSKIDKRDTDGAERHMAYKKFIIANGGTAAQADSYTGKITKIQANELFKVDLINFEKKVKSLFRGTKLRQTQFDALVSITYNAGTVFSKLKNAIKKNPDDPGIAAAFTSNAVTAGGKRLRGLVKRRQRELDFYFGKVSTAQMDQLQERKKKETRTATRNAISSR